MADRRKGIKKFRGDLTKFLNNALTAYRPIYTGAPYTRIVKR